MKKIIFFLIVFIVLSCNNDNDSIKGELTFKLVNFIPQTGFTNKKANELTKILDSINLEKIKNKDEAILYKYLIKLKKHNLLESPQIRINIDGKIKSVFLKKTEFEKIKKFDLNYLSTYNKKVELELIISKLEDEIYYSNKITKIELVNGETSVEK